MKNKELMTLIEEYGRAMKGLGYHNGASYHGNPERAKALITSCKLIAKIEKKLGLGTDNDR